MICAIIENGVVTNIAVAEVPLKETWIPTELPISIGDIYDGESFYRNGEKVISEDFRLRTALGILFGEVE